MSNIFLLHPEGARDRLSSTMENLKLLIGVIGGTLALVLVVSFLFSKQPTDTAEPVIADSALTEGERRHVLVAGEEEAPDEEATQEAEISDSELITIVEFSDLQCPACRSAQPIVDQVVKENPGKVELVYRHFPLESIHEHAYEAAVASEIVAEQGLFWQYAALLFEKQPDWSTEKDPINLFIQYAEEVGADTEGFEEKLSSNTYKDLVETDIKDGYALGVNATPTFYVQGEQLSAPELSAAVAARL